MLENGRGLIKALETWAKRITADYSDVNVRDLSTSFRDGMAFCAIIHHYRPDLIDFETLSKEKILENNSLAFSVAEKQLGVPALLDAEDMVEYAHPDRLSIITYLSQLRNCFENQNKVNIKKPGLKRIQKSTLGPPSKISVVQPSLLPTKRHELCQVCKHRVFILERLIVDGKLYHTTCFRCHKCNCLLNPGAYVESDTSGVYECSVCLTDEIPESPKLSLKTLEHSQEQETCMPRHTVKSPKLSLKTLEHSQEQETCMPRHTVKSPKLYLKTHEPPKEFASREALGFAKSNLSPGSLSYNQISRISGHSFKSLSAESLEETSAQVNGSEAGISVKDRINVFENQTNENLNLNSSTRASATSENKPHSSLDSISPNEQSLNRLSSSFQFNKTSNKLKPDDEKNSNFSAKISSIRTLTPIEQYSGGETHSSKKSEINMKETSEQNFIISNFDKSLSSGDVKDTSPNIKNKYSIKSINETSVVSRDIFKTSLQPLKLNFPSSIRKENTHSPDLSSDSEKTVEIPQIKSSYSVTLPRSNINRNIFLNKDISNVKIINSESNLTNDSKLKNLVKIRRSSFESYSECDGSKIEEASVKFTSKTLNRTSSEQEMGLSINTVTPPLKNDTPIYKNLFNGSDSNVSILEKNNSELTSNVSADFCQIKPNKEMNEVISSAVLTETSHSENDNVHLNDLCDTSTGKISEGVETLLSGKENIQELEEEYPDNLNPFGDDENEDKEEAYPDDLNPFGDENMDNSKISVDNYDESKNPFASDEDEDEAPKYSSISSKPLLFESKSPSYQDSISSSNFSSPTSSLKGTLKKRPAPKPPAISEIFSKDSNDSGLDSSFNSLKSSPASIKRNFQTSSPKIRKNKPAPPPPPYVSQDSAAKIKMTKESDNLKLRSSTPKSEEKPQQVLKKKKRPAPPVPIPMRRDMKKIPLKEILQEMKEIEVKQREYERQGRDIELLIRDRDKDEESSIEEEENIMQLFELVNQKNALFRRQAELMYIKRSQRLEEQQYQVEREIRLLMEKPEAEKTDKDRQKEGELTIELIDIVDQRNSIIDSIEMDRRRELEEDHSVQESIEIKNGDLQIPAEIKQKSSRKQKKEKKSKDKKKEKKKQEEQELGKGTLKRKNLFSRMS